MESLKQNNRNKWFMSKTSSNVWRKPNKISERQQKKWGKHTDTNDKKQHDDASCLKRPSGISKQCAHRRSASRQDGHGDSAFDKRSSRFVNNVLFDCGVQTEDISQKDASKSYTRPHTGTKRNKGKGVSASSRSKKKNTNPNHLKPSLFPSSISSQDFYKPSQGLSSLFGLDQFHFDNSQDSDDSDTWYEDVNEDEDEEDPISLTPPSESEARLRELQSKDKETAASSSRAQIPRARFRSRSSSNKRSKQSDGSVGALASGNGTVNVDRTGPEKRSRISEQPRESEDITAVSPSRNKTASVGESRSERYSMNLEQSKELDDSSEAPSSRNRAPRVDRTRSRKHSRPTKHSKESEDSTAALPTRNKTAAVGRSRSEKHSRTSVQSNESDDSIGSPSTRHRTVRRTRSERHSRNSVQSKESGDSIGSPSSRHRTVGRTKSERHARNSVQSKGIDDSIGPPVSMNRPPSVGRTRSRKYSKAEKPNESDNNMVGGSFARHGSRSSTTSSNRRKRASGWYPTSIAFSNRDSQERITCRCARERPNHLLSSNREDDLCRRPIPAYSDCINFSDINYHKTGCRYRPSSLSDRLRENEFSDRLRENEFSDRLRENEFSDRLRENEFSDRGLSRSGSLTSRTGFYCGNASTNWRERTTSSRRAFDTDHGSNYTAGVVTWSRPSMEDNRRPTLRQRSQSLNGLTARTADSVEIPMACSESKRYDFCDGSSERLAGRNSFLSAKSSEGLSIASSHRPSVTFSNRSPRFHTDAKSSPGLRSRNSFSSYPNFSRSQSFSNTMGTNKNIYPADQYQSEQNMYGKTRESYHQVVEKFKDLNPFKELSHLERAAIIGITMSLVEALDSEDSNTVLEILNELRTKVSV